VGRCARGYASSTWRCHISDAPKLEVVTPATRVLRRRPSFTPTDDQRALVERLKAFNISDVAICNELVRDGVDCRSVKTLHKKFGPELTHAKDRMVNLLGHKVLDIALSYRPNNLAAALALLRMAETGSWREPKATENSETGEAAEPLSVMIYPRREMTREMPKAAVEIEGKSVEVAETAPPKDAPLKESPPRTPIEI